MTADQTKPPSAGERDIFLEALEHPTPPERAAYLERACGRDRPLRSAVEALLQNHKEDSFLQTPAVQAPRSGPDAGSFATTVLATLAGEQAGDRIGRYKLLQEIGEGGAGTVYMAEQEEPIRRRVALKVVKAGMDTKQVLARFEAERQALALMDHPNIAKVLDAGTTETGRPYFVMELVRGIRITEYCDQNHLSTRERLELFIKVCQAIQHAHQKGIIHRDIKPSNLLVTLHDGVPVPKVIDFGIAKAIDQRLTDKTLFTQFQMFVGTPAYTSPEQAEMSGLDIDTRTDIYSLGVLLYELLTGKTPFDAKELVASGLDEMRRTIRDKEPQWPSTRLSTMLDAEITATAKHRHSEPAKLANLIRGDLDWMVMKAIEKDRTRRYQTASELAMDIQRYLNYEPVTARPPSRVYRFQRFVYRNKVIAGAGATVAVVLVAAAVVSSWQAIRATRAEREQSRLRKTAEAAQQNEAQSRRRAELEELAALRRAYNSDMNLVQQALAANNYGRVVDLLNRHRPARKSEIRDPKSEILQDFRQWEWRFFWNQSQSDAAFALPPQTNSVVSVAISPNGRLLASNDRQGTLKLWDLARQAEVAVIRERGFGPSAFAFSPDGGRLAVSINQGPRQSTVKVWTVATREVTAEFAHEGGVDSLAFSPDGTTLLTFGQDLAIQAYDFGQQRLVVRKPGEPMEGWQRKIAVFSPDRKVIAIGDEAGRIRLLDATTGVERSSAEAFEEPVAALVFSPDGKLVAVSAWFTGTTTTIKLFTTATGMEAGQLKGHVSWVPGLAFTPDGKRLVSAGADQTVRVWDVEEGRELAALRGHLSEVNTVAVAPDGKTMVSGCKDGTLFGWDLERLESKSAFETLPMSVVSIDFLPESQGLLTVNETDGSVGWWDAATLRERERITALGNRIARVHVSPDGARVYAGGSEGELKVLDWATRLVITNVAGRSGRGGPPGGRGRGRPGGPGGASGPIGLVDKGRTLVVAGADSTIRLLDTTTWQTKAAWKAGEGRHFFGTRMILSRDERFLLVAGFGGPIDVLNLQNGQMETSLSGQNWGASGLAFSPSSDLLATSSVEGTVTLWDMSSRAIVDVLRGHLLGVHAVAFSPDGQRLASVSHGNEAVKLWDLATRNEVATLAGEGSLFHLARFSPDGKMLVAINRQGKAHVWRAPSLEDIAAVEARRPRSTPR